jgi:lysophospholipase L1-like esterase
VAVPLADARDNLGAIAGLAAARGARVLFVNEANNPDPDPMRPYGELLANLAEETGNHALDAADRFGREANPDHFIDNVHLSVLGHTTLAAWIHDALRETAWLDAPAAAAP